MAEAGSSTVTGAAAGAAARPRHAWKQAWPIPALLVGGVALSAAIWSTLGTTPPADVGARLASSSAMIDSARYGEALELLNTGVLPLVGGEAMTPDQVREFFVQRARALYMGQKDAGISRAENHRAIVKEYREAETRGAVLTPRDSAFLAWTLLELGEIDNACARAAALPEAQKQQRIEIMRAAIEASSQGPYANPMRAMDLLSDLGSELDAPDELRLWVLARHSGLLARQGFADEAITRILRTLPRLENSDPSAVGEVYVTLGEAYVVSGSGAEAGRALARADQLLPREHPRRGLVALLQGELAAEEGDTTRARERYLAVLERAEPGEGNVRALLGLAEVENQASMDQGVSGAPEESMSRYEQLIDLLTGVTRDAPAGTDAGANDAPPKDAPGGHEGEAPAHAPDAGHGEKPPETHEAPDAKAHAGEAEHGAAGANAHGGAAHGAVPGARFTPPDAATIDRVTRSLLARSAEQYEGGRFETALRFAMLAERLHSPESVPRELVMALASARLALAGEILRSASGDGSVLSLAAADPATQREAKGHLLAAGDAFRLYASKVAQSDIREYADALWNAADCFDRAGDLEASVAAFEQFATDMATDVRRPEATFRLAQAQQARGELALATSLYRELIAERASGEQGGEFADASFVPLARTLFMDADPANDAEGESLLQRIVGGELGGPGSSIFRDALFELGSVFYRTGRYARAIERFEEFSKLSGGNDPRATDAEYMLAESHRLSAGEIATELRAAMPEALRRQREGVRGARLRLAAALYDDVRRKLEELPRRTALQEMRLRNCFLYAADCAFDAGDFESAIRRYEAARERYPRDPSSLVAMTQVVSALLAQGERERAVLANARAKRFYQSLPESAWDDPSLPMTRAAWERWLDAQDRLAQQPLAQESSGP